MNPECFVVMRGVGERLGVSALATDLIEYMGECNRMDKLASEIDMKDQQVHKKHKIFKDRQKSICCCMLISISNVCKNNGCLPHK